MVARLLSEFTGKCGGAGTANAGIVLKSLTTAQRDATTPAAGDLFLNTTTGKVEVYSGAAYNQIVALSSSVVANDVANVVSIRNSTNAQTLQIYGTASGTPGTDYVRASLACSTTQLTLAAESGGAANVNVDIVLVPAGTGRTIFRKAGGVAGTDEIQIYADGSHNYITGKKGELQISAAGTGGVGIKFYTGTSLISRFNIDGTFIINPDGGTAQLVFDASRSGIQPIAGLPILRFTDAATGGGAVQFTEMTAPAAPGVNNVIIYAVDNGAGKTQLMALFASGSAVQLGIEP